MPILNPDLSEVQEMGNITPGTYQATIKAATPKTSQKGNPMIELDLAVTVDGKERKRRAWVNVTGAAAYKFDSLLRAVGMEDLADKYKAKEQVPFDTDTLVGRNLNVTIDTEMRDDVERDTVKGFLKA